MNEVDDVAFLETAGGVRKSLVAAAVVKNVEVGSTGDSKWQFSGLLWLLLEAI